MKLEARGAAPSRSRRRSTSCAPGRGERWARSRLQASSRRGVARVPSGRM